MKICKIIYPVLIVTLFLFGCSKKSYLETIIPEKIAGMDLVDTKKGEEATKTINELHQKFVSGQENVVASYKGEEFKADLYISTFQDTILALRSFHMMMKGVSKDTVIYSHFTPRLIGEHNVIMVLGLGQAHYFYTIGKEIYWLQADYEIGEKAIHQLTMRKNDVDS